MSRTLSKTGFVTSPGSRGFNSTTTYQPVRAVTSGLNLTQKAYPSSTSGSLGAKTIQTTDYSNYNPNGTNTGGKTGGKSNSAYNSLLAAYGANSIYDQKKALAQQAYDKSMGALNAAYDAYMSAMSDNLNTTKGVLADALARGKRSVMDDAAQSLKQAYINKMLSEKNLDQTMAAQGLSGGATETTRASMSNNYGNARNEINRTTNNNIAALEGNYNDNLAAAMSAYNQAVAQAQLQKAQQAMEIENALMNNQMAALDNYQPGISDDGSYAAMMQQAMNNAGNVELQTPEILNAIKALEILQPGSLDSRNYNNLLAALQAIMSGQNKIATTTPLVTTPTGVAQALPRAKSSSY